MSACLLANDFASSLAAKACGTRSGGWAALHLFFSSSSDTVVSVNSARSTTLLLDDLASPATDDSSKHQPRSWYAAVFGTQSGAKVKPI
eukprot:6853989-Prymnesium_polylepis.1